MIYFDSSAMVKRYLDEEGSYKVNKMLDETSVVATSILTYPEILSAFIRKQRMRDIPKDAYAKASTALESEWSYFFIIQFSDQLYPAIRRIIERYGLKAADSIHLASALWLKHSLKENVSFVSSDTSLLKAAGLEKLPTVNPAL